MARVLGLVLVSALMACGEDAPTAKMAVDASPVADATSEPDAARPADGAMPAPTPVLPSRQLAVIQQLSLSQEDAPGQSEGIDLDDLTTGIGDLEGCGQRDFTASDGRMGIDNNFGLLIPLIEAAGGEAFGAYLQGSVNDGKFLVMLELDGVDDLANDDEISLSLYRGLGTPFVGNDDRLEAWQTFDIDPEGLFSRVNEVKIRDGVVEAGPFELTLPFYIFDFVFELDLTDARVYLEVGENGVHRGVMAGAVDIENVLSIASEIEGGAQIFALLESLTDSYADLLPDEDGVCQAISATIQFQTVGAFFYADAPRPE